MSWDPGNTGTGAETPWTRETGEKPVLWCQESWTGKIQHLSVYLLDFFFLLSGISELRREMTLWAVFHLGAPLTSDTTTTEIFHISGDQITTSISPSWSLKPFTEPWNDGI